MNLKEEALKYHLGGKIDIVPSKIGRASCRERV